jgi:hypothetical protein
MVFANSDPLCTPIIMLHMKVRCDGLTRRCLLTKVRSRTGLGLTRHTTGIRAILHRLTQRRPQVLKMFMIGHIGVIPLITSKHLLPRLSRRTR